MVYVLGHQPIETVIEIDDVPPSMNDIVGQGNRYRYTKAKRDWGRLLVAKLRESGMKPCDRVVVEGLVTFPTRIKRDQGNYRFLLEKALGDALQTAGLLPDDSWAHYEFGGLAQQYEKGVRRTRLLLMPEAIREAA